MQYTKLGRSGCRVSRLCLGTMHFGWLTDQEESFRMMDRALELGYNFFDTANVYGGPDNKGATEAVVGRWLGQAGSRRERIVLATKFYGSMGSDPNQQPGVSAYKIKREVDDSLRRLQTDHIDLYQMHHIDRTVHWEEIWGAYEDLIRAGKVIYAGSSNFAGWDIAHAQGFARQRGFLGLVSEQHKYSLICRSPELEVLPCCEALGVAVIPWSPIGGSKLGGHALDAAEGSRSFVEKDDIKTYRSQIESYYALCRKIAQPPAVVALAWVLRHPAVTAPIIGPRTMDHLESAVKALKLKLDEKTVAQLEQIFPGPGGTAPQAYAW